MKTSFRPVLTLLCVLCTVSAFGGAWAYHGPKNNVETLIVTANYDQPRLLADLIQQENRQPILFVPSKGKPGKILFCAPLRRSSHSIAIEEDKLAGFIYELKLKRIIVLGDERFVEARYIKLLGRSTPIIVASDDDWQKVADMLTPMLNLTYLSKRYAKLRPQVIAARNNAIVAPDTTSEVAATMDDAKDAKKTPDAKTSAAEDPASFDAMAEPEVLPGANE